MTYGHPAAWSHGLNILGTMVARKIITTDDARDIFESIYGFNPATGKPTPWRKRFVDHLVRFLAYWRLP